MKDYLIGLLAFSFITYGLFIVNSIVSPFNHFSLLEWVGIIGIGIILKAGLDTYYEEIAEH
jgi:hypothetical protein